MEKNLILIGGGGHCKSVIDVAESAGYTILGILDRPEEVGKKVLAYEVTKLVHGEEAAKSAEKSASEIFTGQSSENIPSVEVSDAVGKKLIDVLTAAKILESKSEGRRLIAQNGLTLNDEKISDVDYILEEKDFPAVIRKGKKKFFRILL